MDPDERRNLTPDGEALMLRVTDCLKRDGHSDQAEWLEMGAGQPYTRNGMEGLVDFLQEKGYEDLAAAVQQELLTT